MMDNEAMTDPQGEGKQPPVTPTVQAETQDESSRKSPTGGEASPKGQQQVIQHHPTGCKQIQFNLIGKTKLFRSKRSACWRCLSIANLAIVSSGSWKKYLYQANVLMFK